MTENLDQRIIHHNNPISDLKFTAKGIPWKIFLSITCHSKNHALKLERLSKSKKSRIFIENLKKYPELIEKTLKAASDWQSVPIAIGAGSSPEWGARAADAALFFAFFPAKWVREYWISTG